MSNHARAGLGPSHMGSSQRGLLVFCTRSLHLSGNIIHSISGLQAQGNLQLLDLSENDISCVEGVGNLKQLTTLLLGNNKLTTAGDLSQLEELTSLTTLDLSNNRISDPGALDIIKRLPLAYLRLSGNPIVSKTR